MTAVTVHKLTILLLFLCGRKWEEMGFEPMWTCLRRGSQVTFLNACLWFRNPKCYQDPRHLWKEGLDVSKSWFVPCAIWPECCSACLCRSHVPEEQGRSSWGLCSAQLLALGTLPYCLYVQCGLLDSCRVLLSFLTSHSRASKHRAQGVLRAFVKPLCAEHSSVRIRPAAGKLSTRLWWNLGTGVPFWLGFTAQMQGKIYLSYRLLSLSDEEL